MKLHERHQLVALASCGVKSAMLHANFGTYNEQFLLASMLGLIPQFGDRKDGLEIMTGPLFRDIAVPNLVTDEDFDRVCAAVTAVMQCEGAKELTDTEFLGAVQDHFSSTLTYALRAERHPENPDTPAGLAGDED